MRSKSGTAKTIILNAAKIPMIIAIVSASEMTIANPFASFASIFLLTMPVVAIVRN